MCNFNQSWQFLPFSDSWGAWLLWPASKLKAEVTEGSEHQKYQILNLGTDAGEFEFEPLLARQTHYCVARILSELMASRALHHHVQFKIPALQTYKYNIVSITKWATNRFYYPRLARGIKVVIRLQPLQ